MSEFSSNNKKVKDSPSGTTSELKARCHWQHDADLHPPGKPQKIYSKCFLFWFLADSDDSLSAAGRRNQLLSSYQHRRGQMEINQGVFLLLHGSYLLIQISHITRKSEKVRLLTQSPPHFGINWFDTQCYAQSL